MVYTLHLPAEFKREDTIYVPESDTKGHILIPLNAGKVLTPERALAVLLNFKDFLSDRDRNLTFRRLYDAKSLISMSGLSEIACYLEGSERGRNYAAFIADRGFLYGEEGSILALKIGTGNHVVQDAPSLDSGLLQYYSELLARKRS